MPSIAEIVSTDSRFDILLSALQFVDSEIAGSALVATLSADTTDVTVFAPTDDAFVQLAVDLGYTGSATDEDAVTTFLVTTLDAETLNDVILYHVSPEAKTLAEVAAFDEIATLNGATFSPDSVTLVDNEPDLIDPSLVQTDVQATNGIVHVIDRVLLPVDLAANDAPTITDIVAASGEFDTNGGDFDILLNAVVAAGLADDLDDPTADLTVFAPTDAAFIELATVLGFTGTGEEAALDYLLESLTLLSGGADPIPLLTDVLLYHVAPDSLQASQVLAADQIETVLGVDLTVSGTKLRDKEPDLSNPKLIETDIQASNGVVHVIDGVLIPADLLQSDGSNDVDFIIADNKSSHFSTGLDNDLIDANGGADDVRSGEGNDVALGGAGKDKLNGGDGDDQLKGEAGADSVFGKKGDDVLGGGDGTDILNGGAGADVFLFAVGSDKEIIEDFKNGLDLIDLSDLGIASFAALDEAARISQKGDSTVIILDQGGRIELQGVSVAQIESSDFIFA